MKATSNFDNNLLQTSNADIPRLCSEVKAFLTRRNFMRLKNFGDTAHTQKRPLEFIEKRTMWNKARNSL